MTELYLNGVKMALKPGEVIATTIQANDLTKPDTVQSSFTNTFQVVATGEVRKALGFAENIGSASEVPYQKMDAQVISDGREVLPFGIGELVGHEENSFEVSVFSGAVSFFDLIGDKKISDLNFDEFAHEWEFTNILANTSNSENFIYDLIDRGKFMELSGVDCFDLYPSVFGKLIFDRIISETGFKYSGLDGSELFKRLLLPAIKKPAYSPAFIAARSTHAGTTAGQRNKQANFEEVAFFDSDNTFGYSDGAANLFNPTTHEYVADAAIYVNAEARLMARVGCTGGTVYFRISIYKNNTEIYHNTQKYNGSPFNWYQARGTTYSISAPNVYMAAGDRLYVKVKFWGEDDGLDILTDPRCEIAYATNYTADKIDNRGQDYFRVTPTNVLPRGGVMRLNDVLPDIKQRDFVKFVLQLHNAFPQIDLYTNRIRIIEFNEVETNITQARNWTDKFSKRLGLNYRFGDFAQKNHISYKPHELTPENYGNGVIECQNQNLPEETQIIEFPFSASTYSPVFPGLIHIPIWKAIPGGYEQQEAGERVLYQCREKVHYMLSAGVESGEIEQGIIYKVQGYSKVFYDNNEYHAGDTFEGSESGGEVYVNYTAEGTGKILDTRFASWVNVPVSSFYKPGEPENLNAEKYIIPKYYSSFAGILNQTKYFKALVKLDAADVENYDPSVPIWLEQYSHYFYVNKISEFQAGQLTEVEFIRL